MRRELVISIGAIALALAPIPAWATPTTAPRDVVQKALTEVLGILGNPEFSTEQRRVKVEALTLEQFDFGVVARLSLGRNWRRLSPEQRERFVTEFRRYLSHSYGSRLDRYGQEKVEILGERSEPRGDVTVQTRVVGGQYDGVTIDYRMRVRGDRWRAIDVVIEGVSLVSSYRSQFAEVMSSGGAEALLEKLAERNLPEATVSAE